MRFGEREHFRLGSLKQIANFRHIRHASAGESGTKLICEDGFLLQQKTDVGEVVLIAAHHFRENEIYRGRPENSQALKIQRKPRATRQPIGCENDFHFTEEMGDVKTFVFQFGIGLLLGLPEIHVLIFSSKPCQREDGINVVRGGKCGGAAGITQRKCGTAE